MENTIANIAIVVGSICVAIVVYSHLTKPKPEVTQACLQPKCKGAHRA